MKAVIICDGDIPEKAKIERALSDADIFIAADGGVLRARELGFQPDIIIGDLDSYSITGQEKADVIKDEDQETNDLEKALSFALKKSANSAIVFGATGKRLDHTLKNLSVLLQFDSRFDSITFLDDYAELSVIHSPFKESFEIGTIISLFPLSGKVEGISTDGLKYPLNNEALENGVRDGSSNEAVEETVEIKFKKGDLLLLTHH
ncbi:thiamine diphosphokinase [Rhodohalobacter sulfatireducens]|uniref:Thiamine diphosphokinase n=1 Tax=Rhodohalobacter sulfatireducens TaxID=2911366 RepID=A0ABS9KC49_9BACT|nr:thiamine diphosphokinase [Rhodohalobacter sulfatireducens]MCG2588405.1 thiamine diphosphokinase [Rhodohalobacter sulfatireducens]MDR9364231.1 thiamine diphosphokinase [Balneolaceae bacterium]MDR9407577.1 thiamine diphosphokinase [Balneolaceae bacterium]